MVDKIADIKILLDKAKHEVDYRSANIDTAENTEGWEAEKRECEERLVQIEKAFTGVYETLVNLDDGEGGFFDVKWLVGHNREV